MFWHYFRFKSKLEIIFVWWQYAEINCQRGSHSPCPQPLRHSSPRQPVVTSPVVESAPATPIAKKQRLGPTGKNPHENYHYRETTNHLILLLSNHFKTHVSRCLDSSPGSDDTRANTKSDTSAQVEEENFPKAAPASCVPVMPTEVWDRGQNDETPARAQNMSSRPSGIW